jgi:GTP diphosphokinase / guanosine-3',5'-bis(diphosphate) 3'-diphosphatase
MAETTLPSPETRNRPDVAAIMEAANFAAEKHSKQRRKGAAGEPYINHLLEVAALVSSVLSGPDPNLVIAALLHDSIEDAGVTKEQLAEAFGADVAALVLEVTDDKSLPKAERKRLQVVHAPEKSPRAALIKLADKISNLRAIISSPPADWSIQRRREYFDWAKQVVDGLPHPNPSLRAEFDRLYQQGESLNG